MKNFIRAVLLLLVPVFSSPLTAGEKDAFAGFYKGVLTGAEGYPLSRQNEIYAELYRGGGGFYRMRLFSALFSRSEVHALVKNLEASNGKIKLCGGEKEYPLGGFSGEITPEAVSFSALQGEKKVSGVLKRFEVVSPTMGAEAPKGAKVLFDGSGLDAWVSKDGKPLANWTADGGAMRAEKPLLDSKGRRAPSSAYSAEKFGRVKMHMEFKVPAQYSPGRNTRGNSGVIFGGNLEIQILDSFGSEGYWDECGALYRQTPPQVNACLEPGAWQTFDIEYVPAKFDGGVLADYPRFTVYQNGVCVLRNAPCVGDTVRDVHKFRGDIPPEKPSLNPKTGAYVFPRGKERIQLQEHGDKVEFRNIWVLPLD